MILFGRKMDFIRHPHPPFETNRTNLNESNEFERIERI
jgi:hypothetical protein